MNGEMERLTIFYLNKYRYMKMIRQWKINLKVSKHLVGSDREAVLAPALFDMVMDEIIRKITKGNRVD
jgi:hypothetical protein